MGDREEDDEEGWTLVVGNFGDVVVGADGEEVGGWTADIFDASPRICSVGLEKEAKRMLRARRSTEAPFSSIVSRGRCVTLDGLLGPSGKECRAGVLRALEFAACRPGPAGNKAPASAPGFLKGS